MRSRTRSIIAGFAALGLLAGSANAQTSGVSDTEIAVGSFNDLSGPFAAFGAPAVKAAQMYIDEINAAGGVHGRKIRFIVEDHAYQMPKAIQAINKLIQRDQVFAMLLALGTPMNLQAFPLMTEKRIPSVNPLTAARQMLDPPIDLRFTGFTSYYDQIRAGIKYLKEKNNRTTLCTMFLPTDFGKEVQEGSKDEAKASGMTYKDETTHRPDETDFVGSLQKLQASGCDLVALALTVRQTITAVGTAKRLGWTNVDFLTQSAGFHTAVARVPGGPTEGLYAGSGWVDLAGRLDKPGVKEWAEKFKAATGEDPGTGALLGRSAVETFVRALQAAGRDLTPDSFRKGMESLDYDDPISGNRINYSATDHQGGDAVIISVVKDGNWVELHRQ